MTVCHTPCLLLSSILAPTSTEGYERGSTLDKYRKLVPLNQPVFHIQYGLAVPCGCGVLKDL
jgi:hypothetical protein